MSTQKDPVKNPTWYGNIRNMFSAKDINHMRPHGVLLNDYDYVKGNAQEIYGQIAAKNMPPGDPWSSEKTQTLLNWMTNDYPKGGPSTDSEEIEQTDESTGPLRKRKDLRSLSSDELTLLKKAFKGVMDKGNDDSSGYFKIAGDHGLPDQYCMHHIPGYNPWHRAYLHQFEDALRSIAGCENVTLPYWDFSSDFPDALTKSPLDSYTLPVALSTQFPLGYQTSRYSLATIKSNFATYQVNEQFASSLTKTDWEDFHGGRAFDAPNDTSINAHDGGHVSTGPTMAVQEVAAFDPIFWFYHCNIDRMFWEWQGSMHAKNLNGLLSTITTPLSRNIFTIPALNPIQPFTERNPELTNDGIINSLGNLDVDYDAPKGAAKVKTKSFAIKEMGHVSASDKFKVNTEHVNVRVKGVNRMKIPGSFSVHLKRDGKTIASRAFFQPSEVEKCGNCVDNPIVDFDFKVPLSDVKSGKLEVQVEPVNHEPFGDTFPHKMMGSPTINIRMLLSHE